MYSSGGARYGNIQVTCPITFTSGATPYFSIHMFLKKRTNHRVSRINKWTAKQVNTNQTGLSSTTNKRSSLRSLDLLRYTLEQDEMISRVAWRLLHLTTQLLSKPNRPIKWTNCSYSKRREHVTGQQDRVVNDLVFTCQFRCVCWCSRWCADVRFNHPVHNRDVPYEISHSAKALGSYSLIVYCQLWQPCELFDW